MPKRVLEGKVVSNKMDKTISVLVETKRLHPIYKKNITKTKKYKAHDNDNICSIGDIVRIIECSPISKHKTWLLKEIVQKAES